MPLRSRMSLLGRISQDSVVLFTNRHVAISSTISSDQSGTLFLSAIFGAVQKLSWTVSLEVTRVIEYDDVRMAQIYSERGAI